jgi:isopenicillin N synthase-like dioxygenase
VVFDQLKKDWVEVEQHVKPTDIIAFIGQKTPLFSGNDFYKPTLHKVLVEPNTERNALVFLLDVAK